jgi:hypothetical protein
LFASQNYYYDLCNYFCNEMKEKRVAQMGEMRNADKMFGENRQ